MDALLREEWLGSGPDKLRPVEDVALDLDDDLLLSETSLQDPGQIGRVKDRRIIGVRIFEVVDH